MGPIPDDYREEVRNWLIDELLQHQEENAQQVGDSVGLDDLSGQEAADKELDAPVEEGNPRPVSPTRTPYTGISEILTQYTAPVSRTQPVATPQSAREKLREDLLSYETDGSIALTGDPFQWWRARLNTNTYRWMINSLRKYGCIGNECRKRTPEV